MNLVTLLEERARENPERPALVDRRRGKERVVSYGELARRAAAGAAFLRAHGLRRGSAVLVFHPVSIELYELLLAAFHLGARVMLADPSAGGDFLTNCCRRMPPDAFFGSFKAQLLRWKIPALRKIPLALTGGPWFPGTRRWNCGGGGILPAELPDDEPALITFTSGSTGAPKAAVRSHGFLIAQHRALSRALDFREGEVDLVTLPVFVLANLASGMTSVLAATDLARPGSPDAPAIRRQCAETKAARCAASPAFFEGLLGAGGPPSFRRIYTGGAPVFPDLLERMAAAWPEAEIVAVYGSTEAEPIAHLPADAVAGLPETSHAGGGLCAGWPVDDIELAILIDQWGTPVGPLEDAEFARLRVANGQAGEIVVAGDHVLRGYLDGVGDSETKIRVGDRVWHRTGDAGWLDDAGRLWLLGRCVEKMPAFPAAAGLPADAPRYPFAIECAMRRRFPEIRIAALAWHGLRMLAVGRAPDAETRAIRETAAELGIARVVFLDALPLDRRHNAKIDYPALRRALDRISFF